MEAISVFDSAKIQVMLELGLTFDNPILENMNLLRWLVLYKAIKEREQERLEVYSKILIELGKKLLGVEVKEGVFVPLAAFINPEAFKKILDSNAESYVGETDFSEDEVIQILEEEDGGR